MSQFSGRITDCHIHPALDPETNFGCFGNIGDIKSQIDTLRRAGISRACGAPIARMTPSSFAEVRALNDKALRLRNEFPDFYVPGIHIHPKFPEESCLELERCCGQEAVRWVGELVGYCMGYDTDYATEDALCIMRVAAKHGAVVNFHCDDMDVIETLCSSVPDLNLVLAHPGPGPSDILRRAALVAKHPNLHLDISGSGIDRYGMLRASINMAGKEKILFGTDYPINNPAVYVHGALFEDLTQDEREALFDGNFSRLVSR
ncbi:MAG: hypothetical protein A2X49_03265 [Lentisphaerae bacterium GWF2_52_8]|nr:MAG: hypothetical protein A2X49_03265 [Lentisphaerae bacterium GWF2_52_8]